MQFAQASISARKYLRRMAAVVLFAALLGQAALLAHAAIDVHEAGEDCTLCAAGERLDHGATTSATGEPSLDSDTLPANRNSSRLSVQPARLPLPRGPPALS
ncbi:MAG: hypothetical protein QNJ73_04855 [Gammaproteobacteria bacterium]|nr:hypothetical protein [Gammaproteobacteria bacterium]